MPAVPPRALLVTISLCCALAAGCTQNRAPPPTTVAVASTTAATSPAPRYNEALNATITPPAGWTLDVKPPGRRQVRHFVWVSPSGRTAFGVMRFPLPMPLPHDPILWVFAAEMRKVEGEAQILAKAWDKHLPGVRFEIEGGRYRLRTNFRIRGLTGWMSYAGTLRDQPIQIDELKQAENARDGVEFGRRE